MRNWIKMMNIHTRRIIMALLCIYTVVMMYIIVHIIMRINSNMTDTAVKENDTVVATTVIVAKMNKTQIKWCQPQRFSKDTAKRPVIALVSFPGSGNTWLRYLLQQATGIITGSIYEDHALIVDGLIGETVSNNSVSVVKTHEWGDNVHERFDKAILLIRAAGPAIQSEFNWKKAGHFGHASMPQYQNSDEWLKFVHDESIEWRNINMDWLVNYGKPLHIVLYNDMLTDVANVMRTVINFIELPVSSSNFQCMLRRKHGIFKRKKITRNFDPYPPPLNKVIAAQESLTYRIVEKTVKMHVVNRYPNPIYYKKSDVVSSLLQDEEFVRKRPDFGY